jgi:predicted MFS family arabinose efflux permease
MNRNRWSVLALLSLARTAMAFQFQTVGSLAPDLVDAFALDYARLGTLIGLYLLPGVLIALPGGMLGGRFGAKRVVLTGLALMALGGVLTGFGDSLVPMVVGRVMSGTGAVLMNVLLAKMVVDWFAGREIATAMAVMISSWPLGLALALVAVPPLAAALGWQAVMHLTALMCVLWLIAIGVSYRAPPAAAPPAPPMLDVNLARREWLLVSIAGSIWGLGNVGYIVLISFLPSVFEAKGYTLAQASALVSLLGWAMVGLIPAGGYLADRLGRPYAMMVGTYAVAAVATAALPFVQLPVVAFLVIVLTAALPAGPMAALPALALRAQSRAAGMGVSYTWFYVLMATLPAVAGRARDLTQDAAAPVLFAAAMMLAAVVGILAFRIAYRPPAAP